MTNDIKEYILAEASTDWIWEAVENSNSDQEYLCEFVERMVIDALMDSQLAHKYLKDF